MLQKKKAQAALREQFDALYRSEYGKMLRLARLQIQRSGLPQPMAEDRAQDAVQRTFLVAWDQRESLLQKPSPVGWLYEALKRKTMAVISEERKWLSRIEALSDELPDREASTDTRLMLESTLPQEELLLLKKLYLGGYTYDSLSLELGVSRSALAMKIHRLKKKISKKFAK